MIEFICKYGDGGILQTSTEAGPRLPVPGDFVGLPSGLIVRCQWRYMPTGNEMPVIYCVKISDEHAALWREALSVEAKRET